MAIVKRDFVAKIPDTIKLVDGLNRNDYKWILSLYSDDSWNDNEQRDVLIHFSGSGVTEHYQPNSTAVVKCINRNRHFAVLNYSGTPGTTQPPYQNGWGVQTRNFFPYLLRLSFEVQSALNTLLQTKEINDLYKLGNVYLSGKSRGGAAVVFWAGIASNTNVDSNNLYKRVKGIVNFNGIAGSDVDRKWDRPRDSLQPLSYGMNNTFAQMVHIYNDADDKGNSDIRRRFQFGIVEKARKLNFFYNFKDSGHELNWDFLHETIQCWVNNTPLSYNGKDINPE